MVEAQSQGRIVVFVKYVEKGNSDVKHDLSLSLLYLTYDQSKRIFLWPHTSDLSGLGSRNMLQTQHGNIVRNLLSRFCLFTRPEVICFWSTIECNSSFSSVFGLHQHVSKQWAERHEKHQAEWNCRALGSSSRDQSAGITFPLNHDNPSKSKIKASAEL